jgi:hypothetical protein
MSKESKSIKSESNTKSKQVNTDNFNRNKMIIAMAVLFLFGSMALNVDAANTLSDTYSYVGNVFFQGGNISLIDRITGNSGAQIVGFANISTTKIETDTLGSKSGAGITWTASQNASSYPFTVQSINLTNTAGVVVGCIYGNTTGPVLTANVSLCI